MALDPKAKFAIVADDRTKAAFDSAIRRANSASKQISGAMRAAFAGVSVAAIGSAITSAVAFGDEIGKLAAKTGVGAQGVSELAHAARMADIDIGTLSSALRTMQVNTSKASTGNKELQRTFGALGLELNSIRKLKADEQFDQVADAIFRMRDPADKARAATELFGKAGADLLPMFEGGAEGIRKAREEAHSLGRVLSDEQARLLSEGDKAIKTLGVAWDGLLLKMAIGTVKLGQALDLLDKDEIGELEDQLSSARRELQQITMLPDGGMFDSAAYARVSKEVQNLEERIKALKKAQSELSPPKADSGGKAPPGYKATPDPVFVDVFDREQIARGESARKLADTIDRGVREVFESTNISVERNLDRIDVTFTEVIDGMSVFAEQAARNMQSHFADFLFDPFEDGLDGMAKGFIDTLRRMTAEATAAKVFEALLGKDGGGGALNGFLSGLFGGMRAAGGPVSSGRAYLVGERGPELFMPGASGGIVPNHALGGGGSVTVNYAPQIDARGATQDLARVLPAILRNHGEQMETKIIEGIRRGRYNLGN